MVAADDTSSNEPTARRKRPVNPETAPQRDGWHAAPQATNAGPTPPATAPDPTEAELGRIVSQTVRQGYEVIAENLRLGRDAADRYGADQYDLGDATHDLVLLGRRLVRLSRDLSTIGFDLLGAVLADPLLREAVARHNSPNAPKPKPVPPKTQPDRPLPLTVVFRGPDAARGSAVPTTLQRPDVPAVLSLNALYGSDRAASPITRVAFGAAQTGIGVVAYVTIPSQQPGGIYSGVISDAASHKPLGTLSISIAA